MMTKLVIPGKPIQAMRPRVTRQGTYTPEPYNSYKKRVKFLAKEKYRTVVFTKGTPIKVKINVYRPIPKTGSKKLKIQKANNDVLPTVKPDLDNYIKSVLDGLTGAIWDDDRQITSIEAHKYYDGKPRIEIEVEREKN